MDADGTDQPQSPSPRRDVTARTLLVRCWIESTADAPRLRGTVSELSGERLGAFETLPGLAALLRKILAQVDEGQRPA